MRHRGGQKVEGEARVRPLAQRLPGAGAEDCPDARQLGEAEEDSEVVGVSEAMDPLDDATRTAT
jgi:hypothetical protein